MSSSLHATEKTIFMGQLDVLKGPGILKTTLGSCVGIALIDNKSGVFGLAHIMLPESQEKVGEKKDSKENFGKFADTAIPALIRMMSIPDSQMSRILAKIAGGANMFSKMTLTNSMQIGERNIKAVKAVLSRLGISILGEDLGGEKGRQMVVDSVLGKIFVAGIGEKTKEL